jgi:hypothetical protein
MRSLFFSSLRALIWLPALLLLVWVLPVGFGVLPALRLTMFSGKAAFELVGMLLD